MPKRPTADSAVAQIVAMVRNLEQDIETKRQLRRDRRRSGLKYEPLPPVPADVAYAVTKKQRRSWPKGSPLTKEAIDLRLAWTQSLAEAESARLIAERAYQQHRDYDAAPLTDEECQRLLEQCPPGSGRLMLALDDPSVQRYLRTLWVENRPGAVVKVRELASQKVLPEAKRGPKPLREETSRWIEDQIPTIVPELVAIRAQHTGEYRTAEYIGNMCRAMEDYGRLTEKFRRQIQRKNLDVEAFARKLLEHAERQRQNGSRSSRRSARN